MHSKTIARRSSIQDDQLTKVNAGAQGTSSRCKGIANNQQDYARGSGRGTIARIDHRRDFPVEAQVGATWNGSSHLSTSNACTDNSEPKRTRQSGKCSCGYCRRRKPTWRRSVKTSPVEPAFDRPFLSLPCMFRSERFANGLRDPATSSSPDPVRARMLRRPIMSPLSPHASTIQFGLRQSTRGGTQLLGRVMAAALALFFISSMEISVATGPIEAGPAQIVVRTHKGDRLLGASAPQQHVPKQSREIIVPHQSAEDLKLPEGCDPFVSPFENDSLSQVAGRCVS